MNRLLAAGIALGSIFGIALLELLPPAYAQDSGTMSGMMQGGMQRMMSPGLIVPPMDPASGRKLFASKGCVICHSVNSIGGKDAAPLDPSTMQGMVNPFDFVAKMWQGAPMMIAMQNQELKEQMTFTGQELANIVAFLHDTEEAKKFSVADIPPEIKAHMEQ